MPTVWHASVGDLYRVSVADFVQTVCGWETGVNYSEELGTILVDTLAEKGGLNQVMLRPRVFFLRRFFAFSSYFNTVS